MQNLLFSRPSLVAILGPKLHGVTAKTLWLTIANSEMTNAAFYAESCQIIRKLSVLNLIACIGTFTPPLSLNPLQKHHRPPAPVSSPICTWWLASSRPPDQTNKWQIFLNSRAKIVDICVERCRTLPMFCAPNAPPRIGTFAHFVGLKQLHMLPSTSAPVSSLSLFCLLGVLHPPTSETVKYFSTFSIPKIANTGAGPCRPPIKFCARLLRACTGTLHIYRGSKQLYLVHIASAPISRFFYFGWQRRPDPDIVQTTCTISLPNNADDYDEPCRTPANFFAHHSSPTTGTLARLFGQYSVQQIIADLSLAVSGAELCRVNHLRNVQNVCVNTLPCWPAVASLSSATPWVHLPFSSVAQQHSAGLPFILPLVAVLYAPLLAVVRAPLAHQPMWISLGAVALPPVSRPHLIGVSDVFCTGRLRQRGNCVRSRSFRPAALPRRYEMRLVPSPLWIRTHPSPCPTCAHTCAPRHRLVLLCVRARARTRELTAFRDPNTNPTYRRLRSNSNPNYRRLRSNPSICWRSRPPPPSALELRLMFRAPAPTPPGLVLMTGAGAACEEPEADEGPPVEEGVLDAAIEDDTSTTLPPAPSARGGGRPLPRLPPDAAKWPRGDKIKAPPPFSTPETPLAHAKEYQEAMIYALNPDSLLEARRQSLHFEQMARQLWREKEALEETAQEFRTQLEIAYRDPNIKSGVYAQYPGVYAQYPGVYAQSRRLRTILRRLRPIPFWRLRPSTSPTSPPRRGAGAPPGTPPAPQAGPPLDT